MPTTTESPTVLAQARQLEAPGTSPQTDQEWSVVIQSLLRPIRRESGQLSDRPRFKEQHAERTVAMTNDGGALLLDLVHDLLYSSLWQSFRQFSRFLIGSGRTETPALSPARIVDGSIAGKIRQPHLEAIRWIKETTGYSQERVAELLGVTRQTLNRWDRGEAIKDNNRRRVFAVREVLERAVVKYSTHMQLAEWLDTPRGAGGVTPAQLLTSGEINRVRLLAISTPSNKLSQPPMWVRRSVPTAFQVGAEHPQEAMPPEFDDDLKRLAAIGSSTEGQP